MIILGKGTVMELKLLISEHMMSYVKLTQMQNLLTLITA